MAWSDAAAIEGERAGLEEEFGITAVYSDADMTKPATGNPAFSSHAVRRSTGTERRIIKPLGFQS